MGGIADANAIREGQKKLDESERLGGQLISIVTEIVQLIQEWDALKNDPDNDAADDAVFADRESVAIAAAIAQTGSLTDPQKALASAIIDQVFPAS